MRRYLHGYVLGWLLGIVLTAWVITVSLTVTNWYIEHEIAELTEHYLLIERLDRLEAAQALDE